MAGLVKEIATPGTTASELSVTRPLILPTVCALAVEIQSTHKATRTEIRKEIPIEPSSRQFELPTVAKVIWGESIENEKGSSKQKLGVIRRHRRISVCVAEINRVQQAFQ